ncbi:hypothetical protein V8D89_004120 [Ganoderma adspersum]
MRFLPLVAVALSTAFIGSAEAAFTGQATSFTGLVPIESDTCDGVFYSQQENVVKLSLQNGTPCGATIGVVDEFGRTISGVLVVDTCVGCGENDIVLSEQAFADLVGYIPLPSDTLSVEWFVESEPSE